MTKPASSGEPLRVDLHRHLEGAIRPRTAYELGQSLGVLPGDESFESYRARVVVDRPMPLLDVLACFDVVRKPIKGRAAVVRIAREALSDAAAERIGVCDLRFNPLTLAQAAGLTMDESKSAVQQALDEATAAGVETKAHVCAVLSRRHGLDAAWEVVRHIARDEGATYVGVDFASDELRHRTSEFADVAQELAAMRLPITVHTGEGVGPDYVADALQLSGVARLGHALSLSDDPSLIAEVRARGITLEVCPTSNVRTGLVPSYEQHPARSWLAQGVKVAICTDDPTLFDIDLDHELAVAQNRMGFSVEQLAQCGRWADQARFDRG